MNGPVPTGFDGPLASKVTGSMMLSSDSGVEHGRPRPLGVQHHGVFVGCFDTRQGLRHPVVEAAAGNLRVAAHTLDVPQHVVRRQFASSMELRAFTQVQGDARVLFIDLPAFGQNGLRVELRVQLDEAVPDRVDRALTIEKVAVERRQIAQVALAQNAPAARLFGAWPGDGGGRERFARCGCRR